MTAIFNGITNVIEASGDAAANTIGATGGAVGNGLGSDGTVSSATATNATLIARDLTRKVGKTVAQELRVALAGPLEE